MDLRSLRYFVTVAEERHVGRAAARLHMTQPPLSRAIRQLEDELGASLFQRTPKGVTLTPAGTVMYDEAGTLLGMPTASAAGSPLRRGPRPLPSGRWRTRPNRSEAGWSHCSEHVIRT